MTKASFMEHALEEAHLASKRGEVPVGAVLVYKGEIIARNGNRTLADKDPSAHAEILVIREGAKKLNNERLYDCDLYVTLEPCPMCAGAISFARIKRLYFGASDPKSGAIESGVRFFSDATCHHKPEVYSGILESDCALILKTFFKTKR